MLSDKVSVIIPNYNGARCLRGCLASVLTQVSADRVIVVDDGSTDNSVSFMRRLFPRVRLITRKENGGFAAAVNEGIRASETPYVFLLNNDALLTAGALEKLVDTMEQGGEHVFSVGARMLTLAKPRKIDNSGDLYCSLGWAFSPGRDRGLGEYRRRSRVTSACAGAALYRRKELLDLGGFDEAHFCYLEDVDLGIRARLHGYINLYEPAATVLHVGSATSGSRHNAFKVRLTTGNNLYLLYKNFPAAAVLTMLPCLLIGQMVKFGYFAAKGLGGAYVQGFREGVDKIRHGGDRKQRIESPAQLWNLLVLLFEMDINVIRRVTG